MFRSLEREAQWATRTFDARSDNTWGRFLLEAFDQGDDEFILSSMRISQ